MQQSHDPIVHGLQASQGMLQRFVADLTPEEYHHRACPGGNCAAWLMGHLVLTERRALLALGIEDLPQLPEGFEKRFARDDAAPRAQEFGDVARLLGIWNQHRNRLIEAVRSASPETLARPLATPRPMFATAGEFANFMALHTSMHAGQITIIRRSLGRPPMV